MPIIPDESNSELTQRLKHQAQELGFVLAGVTKAVRPFRLTQLDRWLENGFAGDMHYFQNRREAYEHPSHVLENCKSLLMLGVPYLFDEQQRSPLAEQPGVGKVARYAQCGLDYHDAIRSKLKQLQGWLRQQLPNANSRGIVDTAPLHEREFASAAGLGWIGKNTLLLNRQWGSYFFLAALLTDIDLKEDRPFETSHCGTCTACLDQCPTGAIVEPYVIDSRLCLSHATIESPKLPEPQVRQNSKGWIFGCDICQEVCPWNHRSQQTDNWDWQPVPQFTTLDVLEVLQWDDLQFQNYCSNSPLWRPRRRGMVRNAILVAGAQRLESAVVHLAVKMREDEALLRAAAAWSLGQIASPTAIKILETANDEDPYVQDAISQALCNIELVRLADNKGLRD
jgi:epoxyqueuosine reductase